MHSHTPKELGSSYLSSKSLTKANDTLKYLLFTKGLKDQQAIFGFGDENQLLAAAKVLSALFCPSIAAS